MQFLKSFKNKYLVDNYIKNNFISPHIFLNKSNKSLDYEEKYTPVEYISSTQTGGQYINLNCNLFQNTDDIIIDIKFNLKGGGKDYGDSSAVNQTKPSVLIGSISEVGGNGYLIDYHGFVVRKADIGSSGTVDDTYVTMYTKWEISNSVYKNANGDQNSKQKYYPTYLAGNISGYENTRTGIVYEKRLIIDNLSSITSSKFNAMSSLGTYMFAIWNDTNSTANKWRNKIWRFCEADVYYCKITKGDTVVRDLIPVLYKGKGALYDKVHKKFYLSEGDEHFITGPKI